MIRATASGTTGRGAQGDAAWVMYTWDVPVTIDGADAYYFTDGNFAPKDAKLSIWRKTASGTRSRMSAASALS